MEILIAICRACATGNRPRLHHHRLVLNDEPDDVFLNYALGKAYVEAGRAEEGIEQFQRTLCLKTLLPEVTRDPEFLEMTDEYRRGAGHIHVIAEQDGRVDHVAQLQMPTIAAEKQI